MVALAVLYTGTNTKIRFLGLALKAVNECFKKKSAKY
jgi:hypothetical protein